jgi:hypothetical protein
MRFGEFLGISILLLVLWIGCVAMLHVASILVHLLLLLAVLFLVGHLAGEASDDFAMATRPQRDRLTGRQR